MNIVHTHAILNSEFLHIIRTAKFVLRLVLNYKSFYVLFRFIRIRNPDTFWYIKQLFNFVTAVFFLIFIFCGCFLFWFVMVLSLQLTLSSFCTNMGDFRKYYMFNMNSYAVCMPFLLRKFVFLFKKTLFGFHFFIHTCSSMLFSSDIGSWRLTFHSQHSNYILVLCEFSIFRMNNLHINCY